MHIGNYNKFGSKPAFNFLIFDYIDTAIWNPLRVKGRILSFPHFPIIEPTSSCNLRCPQCLRYRESEIIKRSRGMMSLNQFVEIMKPISSKIIGIGMNGYGESLLNKDFIPMLEYLRFIRQDVFIGFHTNGLLLTSEKSREFIKLKVDSVSISLDAASSDSYELIRGKGDSFDLIVDNIANFVFIKNKENAHYPKINISYNIQKENLGELTKILRLAKQLGVDEVTPINPINPIWYSIRNWKSAKNDVANEINYAKRAAKNMGVEVNFPNIGIRKMGSSGIHHIRNFACAWPIVHFPYITWDGYVLLCCWYPDPDVYNMGNMFETPFKEIWNSKFL